MSAGRMSAATHSHNQVTLLLRMGTRQRRIFEILILLAITALGVWLRFHQIGSEGIWLDESFSWYTARLAPVDAFWWTVARDQHPPLYYLLLHYWMQLGTGEAHDRTLSALFSAGAIPMVYLAGRRLLGLPGAIIAALLITIAPFQIRYAQEVRMYAMLTFNASVAIAALARLVTGDHRRRWWVLYVIFTVLTMLSHNTAVLFLAAVNVGVLLAFFVVRKQQMAELHLPTVRQWIFGQAGVVLLWLPWFPFFLRQVLKVDDHFWIPAPTRWSVLDTVLTLFSFQHQGLWWLLPLILLLFGLILLAALVRPATILLLGSLAVVPFGLELLVSLRSPIFFDRTLIWLAIPLSLLLAATVSVWLAREGAWRALALPAVIALLLLVLANGLSLHNYYATYQRDKWRDAAEWISSNFGEGHVLLYSELVHEPAFNYYFAQLDPDQPLRGIPLNDMDRDHNITDITETDVPAIIQATKGYNCIWLVFSQANDPNDIILGTLRSILAQARVETFANTTVYLFQRTAAIPCATR